MSAVVDDRTRERRQRILEAARLLMLRHGLRGTTMEAIARAAQIAKPTLYAQFADKDAIFAGVLDGVMDALRVGYERGLHGPGDLAERVGAALAGQYGVLGELLAGSPHAAELMGEHRRAGPKLREQEQGAAAGIAAELAAAGVAEPEALTRVIVHAAYGIALKSSGESEMAAGIKLLCRRLIGPDLPGLSKAGRA